MLGNSKAFSGFAVDDLAKAREFYGETLGLRTTVLDEKHGLMALNFAAERDTIVYVKPDFVPATYTILNFPVDDIDEAVDGLSARGIGFERYDGMPQDEKGDARGRSADRLVQGPRGEHPLGPPGALGGGTPA